MTSSAASRVHAILDPYNVGDAPGFVISVLHGGLPLIRRGFGLSSLESRLVNQPATRMRIGSTTKHFACALALLAEQDGVCSIDDPVGRWIPELPSAQGVRTLRQLMNHTGGSRDYLDLALMSNAMSALPMDAALRYQCIQQDDNFSPGDRFIYNNGGYRLLSVALERMLGAPLGELFEERLFRPLQLNDTALWVSDSDLLYGVATNHLRRPTGDGFTRGVFPTPLLGEGGIVSTIDDMQRWLAHLQRPTLWDCALTHQLTAPTRLNNGFESAYGLGLIRERWRGVELLHHAGGVIGGSCQMLTVSEHQLDVVIMRNRNDISASDLALRVVEAVLQDVLSPQALPAKVQSGSSLVGHYYCAAIGEHIELLVEDGKPVLTWFGMPLPLVDAGDGALAVNLLSIIALQLRPRLDARGCVTGLDVREQGYQHQFDRLQLPLQGNCADLATLQGTWHSPDLASRIDLDVDERDCSARMLIKGLYGRARYRLSPLTKDAFLVKSDAIEVPMDGVLRRVTLEDGNVELRFTTMRSRDIRILPGSGDE